MPSRRSFLSERWLTGQTRRVFRSSPNEPACDREQLWRILLMTSGLGAGHSRASEAIELALLERNPAARIRHLDFWNLMDEGIADTVKETYLALVTRYPNLYDNMYRRDRHALRQLLVGGSIPEPLKEMVRGLPRRLALGRGKGLPLRRGLLDRTLFSFLILGLIAPLQPQAGKVIRLKIIKLILALLTKRLKDRAQSFSPDVIVSTQMHPAALLSGVKQWRDADYKTIGVITDYGVHDLWLQPLTGHYCVPNEEVADDLLRRDVPAHRVHVTGIPLMPGFRHLPSCTQAREELGLDPSCLTVLVAGGGLGLAHHRVVLDLVKEKRKWQILVAAGRNGMIPELLGPLAEEARPKVRLFGWMNRMELLIRAADVVVAKPGGLTVAESLACGRPLLAPFSMGGQEGFNLRFLERHGVGGTVAEGELMERLRGLLYDPIRLRAIQNRAWQLGQRDGAERVANLVWDLANNRAMIRGRR